jgi:hypothetical protein
LALELPDTRPQVGTSVEAGSTPGTVQPPEHPAMLGYVTASTKPSRVPSLHAAHPVGGQPLEELLDAEDEALLDALDAVDEALLDALDAVDEALLDALDAVDEALLDAVDEALLDALDAVDEALLDALDETLLAGVAPPAPPLPSRGGDSELLAPHAATSAAPTRVTPRPRPGQCVLVAFAMRRAR